MLNYVRPKVPTVPTWPFRQRQGKLARPYLPSAQQLIRVAADALLLNLALISALVCFYFSTVWNGEPAAARVFLANLGDVAWRLLPVTAVAMLAFGCSGFYTYSRTYRTRHKLVLVAEAVTAAFVVVGMLAYLVPSLFALPRSVLLLGWGIALPVFLGSRLWSALWRRLVWTEAEASDRPPHHQLGTVLVIGGGGYIGSALVPKLLAAGHRVRVLDLMMYGTEPLHEVLDHPMLEIVRADFREIDALVKAMRGVEQVVHLGGIVGDPACALDEELTIDVNLAATRLIAEVAKGNGIRHFVFASSCSVYGASDEVLDEKSYLNPLSLYARTKSASEKVLLEMADTTFTPLIVRFATIYGLSGRTRFDLVVNLLAAKAAIDHQITIFGGDQWRPFLHVDDAALAVQKLLQLPAGRGAEIFNVGSNVENYTITDVGNIIKKYVPDAELVIRDDGGDKRNYRVDFSRIRMMTGFVPSWTVEDGVRQVVEAIGNGRVLDYRDALYSNERFLIEMKGGGLARPKVGWAQDLVRAPVLVSGE